MNTALYYFLKPILYLLSCSPKRFKKFLAFVLEFFLFSILKKRKQVAFENYQKAFPDKSKQQVEAGVKACYRSFSKSLIEYLDIHKLSTRPGYFVVEVKGEHHLKKAMGQKKGVLLLTGHFGSPELAVGILSCVKKYLIGAVARQQSNAFVRSMLDRVRNRLKAKVFRANHSIFSVFKFLKGGGIIFFFLDQFTYKGKKVHFFNRETYAMDGLEVVAKRSRAPVVPLLFYRDNDKHVLEFFKEVPFDDKTQNMTQVYTSILESFIRKYPEQWTWTHRRWKDIQ